jgi:hypothetical protein
LKTADFGDIQSELMVGETTGRGIDMGLGTWNNNVKNTKLNFKLLFYSN